MKTLRNCLIVLSLLLAVACSKNDLDPSSKVRVLAMIKDQKVVTLVDKEALSNFMSEKLRRGSALVQGKSFVLRDLSIERSGAYYYLYGTMTISEAEAPIAVSIELKQLKPRPKTAEASFAAFFVAYGQNYPELGEDGEPGGTITHTCSGVNCRSCSFMKSSTGRIVGCNCNSPGSGYESGGSAYCNHTIVEN